MTELSEEEQAARKLLSWLSGWATTLRIMVFEPELYHFLKGSTYDRDDLVDFINTYDFGEESDDRTE